MKVIDFSFGGLLVEARAPFKPGSVVQLHLSAPDGSLGGTFAFRCLHAHRTLDAARNPAHISALVFLHPPDQVALERLADLGASEPDHRPADGPRLLRLVRAPEA